MGFVLLFNKSNSAFQMLALFFWRDINYWYSPMCTVTNLSLSVHSWLWTRRWGSVRIISFTLLYYVTYLKCSSRLYRLLGRRKFRRAAHARRAVERVEICWYDGRLFWHLTFSFVSRNWTCVHFVLLVVGIEWVRHFVNKDCWRWFLNIETVYNYISSVAMRSTPFSRQI